MRKNPSSTWYYNDWENDEKLRVCTLAAQGLWMRLLCIAARSPEHGVVQIGDLTCSLPDGLTQIASAVGRPLTEIAPLIDELLSSGAASRDRRGRIYCRRMVRTAALSAKRAKAGKLGADVTNGMKRDIPPLPRQTPRQTAGPSRLQDFESSSHGITESDAARASASPDGPPRPQQSTDIAKWADRLAKHRPQDGKPCWTNAWGPQPDSAGHNPLIPPNLYRKWREQYDRDMAALKPG